MKTLKSFEIELVDNRTSYYPEELVEGKCVLELNEQIELNSISVTIRGVAEVSWREKSKSGKNDTYRHFRADEEYLNLKHYLLNSEDGGEQLTLDAGRHEYEFSFTLPKTLPPSFESSTGTIRYWLKAEVDKSMFKSYKSKQFLTIISPINLNDFSFLSAVEHTVEKTLCCCLCRSGIISISAVISKTGFNTGESFEIAADFRNNSNRTVKPYVCLEERQTFYARGHSKKHYKIHNLFTEAEQIGANGELNLDKIVCEIPGNISPTIDNCPIITVEYFLQVCLGIPCSLDLQLSLPVTIGE